MDSYMGISDESLRIIEKWEVQRLYGTLEEYENAKKLAERVIELEDKYSEYESKNRVSKQQLKEAVSLNTHLSHEITKRDKKINEYHNRLIKVRVRSFFNRIFAKLGYTQKED